MILFGFVRRYFTSVLTAHTIVKGNAYDSTKEAHHGSNFNLTTLRPPPHKITSGVALTIYTFSKYFKMCKTIFD